MLPEPFVRWSYAFCGSCARPGSSRQDSAQSELRIRNNCSVRRTDQTCVEVGGVD